MKRTLLISLCLFLLQLSSFCQDSNSSFIRQIRARIDSIMAASENPQIAPAPDTAAVDSVRVSIFEEMPSRSKGDAGNVSISQSSHITALLSAKAAAADETQVTGYRIRIYFSNAQNARNESSAAQIRFEEKYPGYSAYRIYSNPNFKVTVCDFRNRSDALRMLEYVKQDFPAAFIVSEKINTPW